MKIDYIDDDKEIDMMINTLNRIYFDKVITPYKNSEKIIDMHAHTKYSDGQLSPDELIRLAVKKNIGVLAITDHDTIAGLKNIDRNNSLIVDSGIKIINGIELTAQVTKGKMHILGYDIDINNKDLNNIESTLRDNRFQSVLSVLEQIKRDYDIRFYYEDIKNMINESHSLGRPELGKLCVKYGYTETVQEAFNKYLNPAKKKTKQFDRGIKYPECLELIINSGGIPVLAHPKSLKLEEKEFLILLEDMIKSGLQGIEVYHSSHTKEEMEYYLSIANKYNLLISGGSDYHGINVKPDVELGTGINNNIKIKRLSLVDKILNK